MKADTILCCGEDLREFKAAAEDIYGRLRKVHSYRCYALLERRDASFVWTGIGSGCIEPLMCEIADEPALRRIILVGTAGSVSNRGQLGVSAPIREARVACAGVSPRRSACFPNWEIPNGQPTRRIVSTDYYYGFTLKKDWPARALWAADTRLEKTVVKALAKADLVDMETGQFYHLCSVLRPDLLYLAIKGAANPLSDFSQQVLHSESVLHDALRKAKAMLA